MNSEQELKSRRIQLEDDGELSVAIPVATTSPPLEGEPAPPLSLEEFEILRKGANGKDSFENIRHLAGTINERIRSSYTPWQPGDPIRWSAYSDEYQDDISPEEEELAQHFLSELDGFRKQWPGDKAGKSPGRYYSLMRKGFLGSARAEAGEAWGFDFLRQKYGDDIVDEYFSNARQVYRGMNVLEDSNDRKYLALVLYIKQDDDHRFENIFGEHVSPKQLNESDIYWKEFDRNDLLDIFVKQYIYFLRFVHRTDGRPIGKKKK